MGVRCGVSGWNVEKGVFREGIVRIMEGGRRRYGGLGLEVILLGVGICIFKDREVECF